MPGAEGPPGYTESYQDSFRVKRSQTTPNQVSVAPILSCQLSRSPLTSQHSEKEREVRERPRVLCFPTHVFLSNQWENMGTRSPSPTMLLHPTLNGRSLWEKKIGVSKRKAVSVLQIFHSDEGGHTRRRRFDVRLEGTRKPRRRADEEKVAIQGTCRRGGWS